MVMKPSQDSPSRSIDDDERSRGDDDVDARKQSNRACDYCHRMKMKCIGKENPPCNRCRQSGQACTFNGPRKTKSSKVDDRLRLVENQMTSMQSALSELIQMQRAAVSGNMGMMPPPSSSGMGLGPMNEPFPSSSSRSYRDISSPPISNSNSLPQYPPRYPYHLGQNETRDLHPEGEELNVEDVMNSPAISPWNSMCSLAEAARLKHADPMFRRGSINIEQSPREPGSNSYSTPDSDLIPKKRKLTNRRRSMDELHHLAKRHSLTRHEFLQQPPDPIEEGICDVATARAMYDIFMENCLMYMPCFDPEFDTFESLRRRSSFCITAIIMIGAKVTDAGGPISELQRRCREHAETIGMATLFTPIACTEAVQAMIALASWGDTAWRPGGHATRMAMDLGLYRCLPLLMQSGMGKGKSGQELRAEWPLVEGARTWLTLYKLEQEMAFNLVRPCMIGGAESIKYCREYLKHPLSVKRDARLVASCELLTFRLPLHNPLALTAAEAALIPDLDAKMEQHESSCEEWYNYWDRYYEDRGVGPQEFLRQSLSTMRAGSQLNINTRLLHGIHNARDVAALPPHRRQWLVAAARNAETIVSMALRSGQYKANFKHANFYTHLNVAFAARCLIRLASLVPEQLDVMQLGRDIEDIADVLNEVPGFQYGELLRQVALRARGEHVLPPQSPRPIPGSSTAFDGHHLGNLSLGLTSNVTNNNANGGGPLPFDVDNLAMPGGGGAHNQQTPSFTFDFGYAEQLLADESGPILPHHQLLQDKTLPTQDMNGTIPMTPSINLDTWFPFPRLDGTTPMVSDQPIDAGVTLPTGMRDGSAVNGFGTGNGQQNWWS